MVRFSIVLRTASELVILSVTTLPVVKPGMVIALPVTSCNGENSSLLMEVLCIQAAALTRELEIRRI